MHFGHIGLATWVVEHTDLDELWLMVSPNNPLKEASTLADEQERLRGVQQAVDKAQRTLRPGKKLRASDFEFALPRPSYTAETLRQLQQRYPEYEFTLVIGEDNLALFSRWREHEWIAAHFRILVYPRHSHSGDTRIQADETTTFRDLQILRDAPYFDISSTEIRERGRKRGR